jgi:hypothetical protein
MLTPEQQAVFVEEASDTFLSIPGGWGKNGTYPYSPGGGERGCADRRSPNGVETADSEEHQDRPEMAPDSRAHLNSTQEIRVAITCEQQERVYR